MDIALDEVIHFDAVTHHPSTGAVTDADSTPTWSIFEEDTDTAILSAQNFTKRTSLTGNYRGSATLSEANGFEVGKWYNVIGSATVNSIAGKAVVMRFRCAAAEATAGYPPVTVKVGTGTGEVNASGGKVPATLAAADVSGNVPSDLQTIKTQTILCVAGVTISSYVGSTGVAINGTTVNTLAGHDPGTTLGTSTLTQADIRTATGLAAANLDTQIGTLATAANLSTVAGYVDTEVAAIKAKTDNLPADPAAQSAVEAAITAATSGLATETNATTNKNTIITAVGTPLQSGSYTAPDNAGIASAASSASTAATNTTDLPGMIESNSTGGVHKRFKANALEQAPSGGGGTVVGPGSTSVPFTINSSESNPIAECDVWVTSDADGDTVVAGTLRTDVNGLVTFMLDAGDYWLWRQKSGWDFTNPQPFTVD